MTLNLPSPIQKVRFKNIDFFIKRDDLIDRDFSGNKARKFHYFLDHDFPHIKRVVSYGSSQSNAMYSLSVLAKLRGWSFDYYVDHVSGYLRENPHGNYAYALQNGMNIIEGEMKKESESDTLFISEGGRGKEAAYGIKKMADEIVGFFGDKKVDIFLPSGTGTTALFLQKYLPYDVYTTACVGDEEYLKKQFFMLDNDSLVHPKILKGAKKYHFGKLYDEFFKIWIELKQETNIVFDLVYDPKGWLCMMKNIEVFKHPVLYIHQGGIIGNESMIKRYERKISEKIR